MIEEVKNDAKKSRVDATEKNSFEKKNLNLPIRDAFGRSYSTGSLLVTVPHKVCSRGHGSCSVHLTVQIRRDIGVADSNVLSQESASARLRVCGYRMATAL